MAFDAIATCWSIYRRSRWAGTKNEIEFLCFLCSALATRNIIPEFLVLVLYEVLYW